MKEKIIESLKKRTFADMICSIVVTLAAIGFAIAEFCAYGATEYNYPEHLSNGIYALFVMVITVILSMILVEVRKIGKPFSKTIIMELRILAIVIMLAGVIPDVISGIMPDFLARSVIVSLDAGFVLTAKNVLIVVLGVVVGIVSEIFVYGYELQSDVDSIA